jgi:hypothetical protein
MRAPPNSAGSTTGCSARRRYAISRPCVTWPDKEYKRHCRPAPPATPSVPSLPRVGPASIQNFSDFYHFKESCLRLIIPFIKSQFLSLFPSPVDPELIEKCNIEILICRWICRHCNSSKSGRRCPEQRLSRNRTFYETLRQSLRCGPKPRHNIMGLRHFW